MLSVGFFDLDAFHRHDMVFLTERFADRDVRDAGHDDDIAAVRFIHADTGKPFVDEDLRCLFRARIAFVVADDDAFLSAQRALIYASDAKASDVFIVCERGYLHLQRFIVQIRISVAMLQDRFKQRLDAVAGGVHVILHDAFARDPIEDREIELLVGRVQIQEQLIDFIDDFLRALIFLIDLVDEQGSAAVRIPALC